MWGEKGANPAGVADIAGDVVDVEIQAPVVQLDPVRGGLAQASSDLEIESGVLDPGRCLRRPADRVGHGLGGVADRDAQPIRQLQRFLQAEGRMGGGFSTGCLDFAGPTTRSNEQAQQAAQGSSGEAARDHRGVRKGDPILARLRALRLRVPQCHWARLRRQFSGSPAWNGTRVVGVVLPFSSSIKPGTASLLSLRSSCTVPVLSGSP